MVMNRRKIIVAVTGASGAVYAVKLLERLRSLPEPPAETAVIFTGNAEEIMLYETGARYSTGGHRETVEQQRLQRTLRLWIIII